MPIFKNYLNQNLTSMYPSFDEHIRTLHTSRVYSLDSLMFCTHHPHCWSNPEEVDILSEKLISKITIIKYMWLWNGKKQYIIHITYMFTLQRPTTRLEFESQKRCNVMFYLMLKLNKLIWWSKSQRQNQGSCSFVWQWTVW